MANGRFWKEGEGYDVHLLRGGPPSKKLRDALDLTGGGLGSIAFIPNLAGTPADHGIEVNAQDGIVQALLAPPPMHSVHNFILSVVIKLTTGPAETDIRIHVHDDVEEIWLTPTSLAVHQGTNETRFTVLARFRDGVFNDVFGDV